VTKSCHLRPFPSRSATDADYAAWTDLTNREHYESRPDDPPSSVDLNRRSLQSRPDFEDSHHWVVEDADGRFLARGTAARWLIDTNQHLGALSLYVLPEYRQQGLAKQMLEPITAMLEGWGKALAMAETVDRIPTGNAFMERLGGELGQKMEINQLDLTGLDPTLLQDWLALPAQRAPGYRLEWHVGPYPDALYPELVQVKEAINLMPRGDLAVEDVHFTEEHLRQMEASLAARGTQRWTLLVRAPEAGEVAGYTEMYWNPEKPALLYQGDTAVFPQHQNRGLGRWLKAAMLDRLGTDRPEGRFVRTGNASSNAPMLKINHELGFDLYLTQSEWQVPVANLRRYLTG